jgi:hypothetical protein
MRFPHWVLKDAQTNSFGTNVYFTSKWMFSVWCECSGERVSKNVHIQNLGNNQDVAKWFFSSARCRNSKSVLLRVDSVQQIVFNSEMKLRFV